MSKQIQWFPGHMKKALIEIEAKIKIVDVVVELKDARCPLSTTNKFFEKLLGNKPRLVVLMKKDLADEVVTKSWIRHYNGINSRAIDISIHDKQDLNRLKRSIVEMGQYKIDKSLSKGMKKPSIKVMIIGVPNVGKSSLINLIAKRKSASVENKPGHTRAQQWIKVNNEFELLDTPGVLPMHFEDELSALNVALVGSIKTSILPLENLANAGLELLLQYNFEYFKSNFGAEHDDSLNDVFGKICAKKGYLAPHGYNVEKAHEFILNEIKNGRIAKISLEKPQLC